jgi:hypothetical protein
MTCHYQSLRPANSSEAGLAVVYAGFAVGYPGLALTTRFISDAGGHDVRLALRNPTIRLGMKKDASSLQFREGAVAVLTPAKPDLIDRRRGMHHSDSDKEEQDSNQLRVAGVVIKYVQGELRGDADWLVVRLYADKAHAG